MLTPPPPPLIHILVSVSVFFSSGAAVDPEGPAPKGMLANFTVLLTTLPPPPRPPQPLSVSAAAVAYEEEADVRDALVDRDVAESIVCRRRYRILPDFGPGDRPYVVSERVIRAREGRI